MNRFLLTMFTLLCVSALGSAEQLGEQEAKNIAKSFFMNNTSNGKLKSTSSSVSLAYKSKNLSTGIEGAYYVFNRGVKDGFVVVAGDDAVARSVLGYSETGTFDYENIPENMRYWLDEYQRQIEYLQENNIEAISTESKEWTTSVAPLLGEIKWGQDSPYNLMCPTLSNGNKAAAGCVATAMAQIMYFWQWPYVGVGYNSYEWVYGNKTVLSADFSQSIYEWEKMSPVYNATSSAESKQAVAKLISDVGISVNMNYGPSSGANSNNVINAFLDYFNYDKNINQFGRISFRSDEWDQMLKKELDEGRPVYYSGQSSNSGHAFVCDGYDENGYFHFNWGWEGYADGYFLTTVLDPTQERTDGVSDGYAIYQGITIGIQPPNENSTPMGYFNLDFWLLSTHECELGESLKISMSDLWSVYSRTLDFDFALNLYRGDELVKSELIESKKSVVSLRKFGSYVIDFEIPETLQDGEYRIYPQYKLSGEPDSEYKNMKVDISTSGYIKVVVSNGKINAKFASTYKISCTSITTEKKIVQNRAFRVKVTMKNTGDEEYWERLYAKVVDSSKETLSLSPKQMVLILGGEETDVEFELPAVSSTGYYSLVICDYNDKALVTKAINIQTVSTPNLNITQDLVPESTEMIYNEIGATAKIKNTGGYFNGNIELMIYDENHIHRRFYDYISIDTNEEITLLFKGAFEEAVIGKEYTMALRRYDVTNKSQVWGKQVKFTLVAEKSAIDDVAEDVVNISLADGVLTVLSKKGISEVTIYSLSGAIVAQAKSVNEHKVSKDISLLENGLYIVRVVNSDGELKVQKIKK